MLNPAITHTPDIMGGAVVFQGTRVPFQTLLEYLEQGDSIDDFLSDFPTVTHEQVIAILEQAKHLILVSEQVVA